jgi:hypothetical protein
MLCREPRTNASDRTKLKKIETRPAPSGLASRRATSALRPGWIVRTAPMPTAVRI